MIPHRSWKNCMARKFLVLLFAAAVLQTVGCMLVDVAVDPVGCGAGTHKPVFPWYPAYLFSPELSQYGDRWRGVPADGQPRPLYAAPGAPVPIDATPMVPPAHWQPAGQAAR